MITTLLSVRGDKLGIGHDIPFAAAVLLSEILHREMNSLEIAAGNRQITGGARAAREQDRIELLAQFLGRDIVSHVCVHPKLYAFPLELPQAPVENALLHLEFRYAVA